MLLGEPVSRGKSGYNR